MKTIAVIGTGSVAQTLASKFLSLGYDVMMGTRNVVEKLAETSNDTYGGPRDIINGGDHFVFVCGNHQDAKDKVKEILRSFGWQDKSILDLGDISSSRGTEMFLPLWLRVMNATKSVAFNVKIVS